MLENFAEIFNVVTKAEQPSWLLEHREAHIASFKAMDKPHRKLEAWRYTTLKPISSQRYVVPSCLSYDKTLLSDWICNDDLTIVVQNGSRIEFLSAIPSQLIDVRILTEHYEQAKVWLSRPASLPLAQMGHAFVPLHEVLWQNGLRLHVKKGSNVQKRLHIIHLETDQGSAAAHASAFKLYLDIEKDASLQLQESFVNIGSSNATYFQSQSASITLGQGAQLYHTKVQCHGDNAASIRSLDVELEKDASYKNCNIALKGRWSREQIHLKLNQPGAHGQLDAAYIAAGDQYVDFHTRIEHCAPYTRSSQLCKGVLGDKARAVFDGAIKIVQDAQQVAADQLNKTLLLSSEAEIDTKPQMEIDADDVKCSHGATVGQLDEEQVFYLVSRGITPKDAKRMLAEGFISEVLNRGYHLSAHLQGLVKDALMATFHASDK